ncbi:MAG TPA: peptide-methionine (S)-S-oxide reductase MsrA [Thermoplasmata archaeon]|nr:peptide-methionine (S)-S-oxide reductase MsrA [Thermoplasmata archaeon]
MATDAAPPGTETIVLAGGCFWCTEAVFSELRGVVRVLPGYSGGTLAHPTYEQVCTGATGHAEVVEVVFDPAQVSLHDLLIVFLTTHDPTTKDRQGADVGTQYRSAIFVRSPAQRATAEAVVREVEAEHVYRRPVVTQIEPFAAFYPAEEYHRQYYRRNPEKSYCQVVIAPKLSKFRKEHAAQLVSAR